MMWLFLSVLLGVVAGTAVVDLDKLNSQLSLTREQINAAEMDLQKMQEVLHPPKKPLWFDTMREGMEFIRAKLPGFDPINPGDFTGSEGKDFKKLIKDSLDQLEAAFTAVNAENEDSKKFADPRPNLTAEGLKTKLDMLRSLHLQKANLKLSISEELTKANQGKSTKKQKYMEASPRAVFTEKLTGLSTAIATALGTKYAQSLFNQRDWVNRVKNLAQIITSKVSEMLLVAKRTYDTEKQQDAAIQAQTDAIEATAVNTLDPKALPVVTTAVGLPIVQAGASGLLLTAAGVALTTPPVTSLSTTPLPTSPLPATVPQTISEVKSAIATTLQTVDSSQKQIDNEVKQEGKNPTLVRVLEALQLADQAKSVLLQFQQSKSAVGDVHQGKMLTLNEKLGQAIDALKVYSTALSSSPAAVVAPGTPAVVALHEAEIAKLKKEQTAATDLLHSYQNKLFELQEQRMLVGKPQTPDQAVEVMEVVRDFMARMASLDADPTIRIIHQNLYDATQKVKSCTQSPIGQEQILAQIEALRAQIGQLKGILLAKDPNLPEDLKMQNLMRKDAVDSLDAISRAIDGQKLLAPATENVKLNELKNSLSALVKHLDEILLPAVPVDPKRVAEADLRVTQNQLEVARTQLNALMGQRVGRESFDQSKQKISAEVSLILQNLAQMQASEVSVQIKSSEAAAELSLKGLQAKLLGLTMAQSENKLTSPAPLTGVGVGVSAVTGASALQTQNGLGGTSTLPTLGGTPTALAGVNAPFTTAALGITGAGDQLALQTRYAQILADKLEHKAKMGTQPMDPASLWGMVSDELKRRNPEPRSAFATAAIAEADQKRQLASPVH